MADLGEGPGGPVSLPPPPLSLGEKKRKAGRASDKKKNLPPPPFSSRSGFATDTEFFEVVSLRSVIGPETRPISYKTKINLVFPALQTVCLFSTGILIFFLDIFVFPYPTVKRSRWILICPHVTEPW